MPRGRKKIQPIQASTEIITNEIVPVDSAAPELAETAAPAEKTRKKPGRKPTAKKEAIAEKAVAAEKAKKKPGRKPAAKKEVIAETAAPAEKAKKKPGRKPAAKKEVITETAAPAEKIKKKPGRKPAAKKEAIAEKAAAPAEKVRKKPGRKPGTAASKAKSKKAGKIEEIVFQSSGNNYTMSEIIEKCKDAYRGGTRKRISEIQVYVKSENGIMKAYYVVNGKAGEYPVEL